MGARINFRGYWEDETDERHGVDPSLAFSLRKFFTKEAYNHHSQKLTIIDIGCGNGYYTKYLNLYPLHCVGYDGNPNTEKITDNLCKVADFTVRQILGKRDWVLSLEVGEHIPSEFEDIFIDNLDKHNKEGMVISWAIEGQGGDGHVNCHNNDYVTNKICKLGYKLDINNTQFLRNSASAYPFTGWWFTSTIFVFRKI